MRQSYYVLILVIAVLIGGCAPQRQSLYNSWGQQLTTLTTITSVEDVSFLLGSPPVKCDAIEPTPIIGIILGKKDTVILNIRDNSFAAKAGMVAGERIKKINNTKVSATEDLLLALRNSLKWNEILTIETERKSYSLYPSPPSEAIQCYWDISGGSVSKTSGAAYVNQYGGSAGHSGAEYQRFFRTSCRFYDDYAVSCNPNWQE